MSQAPNAPLAGASAPGLSSSDRQLVDVVIAEESARGEWMVAWGRAVFWTALG